ncbi:hypothetical protein EV204_105244 [Tissierella praeacuta]|uniref:hypothetical protein n=1 Tax=Tissierella praeacuta TaxID=43131 RepID=UPI0010499571|nr:hypothetical protein [Tissierella praeacuta]TCU72908.1 hypothetical protein EV204_105244 [Tissierella praeacuta]
MKNYQISSGQIPHLVRLTADLFREMSEEIDPVLRPRHMHFVADLLKELVDTAYPIKEKSENRTIDNQTITDEEVNKSLYDAYLALAKIIGLPKRSILSFEELKKSLGKIDLGGIEI